MFKKTAEKLLIENKALIESLKITAEIHSAGGNSFRIDFLKDGEYKTTCHDKKYFHRCAYKAIGKIYVNSFIERKIKELRRTGITKSSPMGDTASDIIYGLTEEEKTRVKVDWNFVTLEK